MKKTIFIALALIVASFVAYDAVKAWFTPKNMIMQVIPDRPKGTDVRSVVEVSLKAIKAQNRITPMSASYVAIVTSEEEHLWGMMQSRKTLIMPGRVRYEVDLSKLQQRDLRWDAVTKTLRVRLPAIEVSDPDIDLLNIKEFADGAMTTFSSVDHELDAANRKLGMIKLAEQARDPKMIIQARRAAAKAIEQTFEMPMRAAGIRASVVADFA